MKRISDWEFIKINWGWFKDSFRGDELLVSMIFLLILTLWLSWFGAIIYFFTLFMGQGSGVQMIAYEGEFDFPEPITKCVAGKMNCEICDIIKNEHRT